MACQQCGKPYIEGYCATCLAWQREHEERQRVTGICKHRYFEGNTYLGERVQHQAGHTINGEVFSQVTVHTAYFCPVCGEIWAREILEPQYQYKPAYASIPPWSVEMRRCPEHGDGYLLSSLGDHYESLLGCSPSLLQREAYILLLRNPS